MTKLINELKGQKCSITFNDLNPFTGKKMSIECEVIDVDNEWAKISFIDKKGNNKTNIIRIETISNIEL